MQLSNAMCLRCVTSDSFLDITTFWIFQVVKCHVKGGVRWWSFGCFCGDIWLFYGYAWLFCEYIWLFGGFFVEGGCVRWWSYELFWRICIAVYVDIYGSLRGYTWLFLCMHMALLWLFCGSVVEIYTLWIFSSRQISCEGRRQMWIIRRFWWKHMALLWICMALLWIYMTLLCTFCRRGWRQMLIKRRFLWICMARAIPQNRKKFQVPLSFL